MQGKKTSDTLARQIQRFLAHNGSLREAQKRFSVSRNTVIRCKRADLPPDDIAEISHTRS